MSVFRRMADGLTNVMTGLGTRADARTSRAYSAGYLTQQEIEAAYRGSGMLRKVIDIPALDMVREWRDWQAEADQIEAIEAEERRLSIQAKVRQAEVMRGLGGGALILGVPGDPALPVNLNTLGKGNVAFIHVVSRWQLTLGDIVGDPSDALFGGPRFFTIQDGGTQRRIHPSRVICFRGDPLPSIVSASAEDLFWGEGRLQRVLDAAMNLDEVLASFAALIKDARNIDIGVSKLMELVATADGEAALMKRLQIMVQGSSIMNANLYDAGDGEGKGGEKIDRHQLTWTGIPDIIRVNAEALAAVSDIPMTRLWGKAAEGMSASGDSQQRDWAKMVVARQNLDLRPCLDQLDAMLVRSAGVDPAKVWFKFAPLDTPSEKDEADRFKVTLEAVTAVQNTGSIPDVAFTKALQNTLTENGWMPGLEGALAELDEEERFGLNPEPDDTDPSELTEGGDPASQSAPAAVYDPRPRRRAANDRWMVEDWAPKTLYVRRDVLNRADIVKWAQAQGFTDIVPDLHVTITYSETPVDWMKMGESWRGKLEIEAGGPRLVEALGPDGKYKALLFTAYELVSRNQEMRDKGASFSWAEYQPHISIQPGGDIDLAKVKPYTGKIVLGPEIFEEIRA